MHVNKWSIVCTETSPKVRVHFRDNSLFFSPKELGEKNSNHHGKILSLSGIYFIPGSVYLGYYISQLWNMILIRILPKEGSSSVLLSNSETAGKQAWDIKGTVIAVMYEKSLKIFSLQNLKCRKVQNILVREVCYFVPVSLLASTRKLKTFY